MTSFLKIFKKLKKKNCINFKIKKHKLLCSISGGQDSMFLLFLFLHLQVQWKFKLDILYCNHLWQKSNFYSYREVYKIAYFFKIPIYFKINENFASSEVLSRNWRQMTYSRLSLIEKYDTLLLAHTATDQIETAFFNLLRGSSPKGISSLKPTKQLHVLFFINLFPLKLYNFKKYKNCSKFIKKKEKFLNNCDDLILYNFYYKIENIEFFVKKLFNIKSSFLFEKKRNLKLIIARPLLKLHRNDIITLLKYYKIPIFCDFTNNSFLFTRNLIRHKFFVDFRAFFNLSFDSKFYQFLDILKEDELVFDQIFKKLLNKKFFKNNFLKIPKSIQRYYIHLVLYSYLKKKCSFYQIERLRIFLKN